MKSIWLLAALTIASGCSADARCAIDADCFSGESCVDRKCAIVSDSAQDVSNIGGDASSMTGDVGMNSDVTSGADDGTTVTADMGQQSDMPSPADLGQQSDMVSLDSCEVDPFTFTCEADGFEDNDRWIDGNNLVPQIVGCNPDFIAHDDTYLATMCLDGSDWYYFNFRPCASGYVIEWQLILESDCDPSLVAFEPLSFKCEEDFVDCTTVDGKPTIRMLVSEQNFQNLQSTYVQVHNKDRNDVAFEYRIRVSVRQ